MSGTTIQLEHELEGKKVLIGIAYYLNHHEIVASPCSFNWIDKLVKQNQKLRECLKEVSYELWHDADKLWAAKHIDLMLAELDKELKCVQEKA